MKSLHYFLIIFSILFTSTLLAQNENNQDKTGVSQYLNNTVLPIASAKKNLLMLNITEEKFLILYSKIFCAQTHCFLGCNHNR